MWPVGEAGRIGGSGELHCGRGLQAEAMLLAVDSPGARTFDVRGSVSVRVFVAGN